MKIGFLNPPFLSEYGRFSREQRSPAITKSGTFYYPMWLAYVAGYAEKTGHEVQLLDAPAEKLSNIKVFTKIKDFKPKLIVVSTSTPSIYNDINVAAAIKNILPNAFIVIVGVHVTALPKETLNFNSNIDAVAIGEYEETIVDLANNIEVEDFDFSKISGLVFRSKNDGNKIITNISRDLINNLDEIPWVSRTYKKFLNYKNYFYSGNLYPLIVFNTSRGCPHKCSFCVYPQIFTGHHFRCRSVEDVVGEMEYVKKEFSPIGEIMFEDDTLTIKKDRTITLCEEILKRKLKIRWSCNARAQLDLETMKIMKRSGCRSLLVGFESGSGKILKGMHKGNKLELYEGFMHDSRKAGLLVNGTFLVGCPGETKNTMNETLEMAKKLRPDVAQFFPVMVYPGTELYDEYKKKNYIVSDNFRDWLSDEGLHNCVVSLPNLSAKEMVEFCDKCRRQFYLRPNYFFYKTFQSLKMPREGIRTFKALKRFLKPLLMGTKLQ